MRFSQTMNHALIPLVTKGLIFCFSISPPLAYPASPDQPADKKHQIEKIEEDLSREKEQFEKFGEKEKTFLEQLSLLEKDIEEKRSSIKELQQKLSGNKRALKERETKLRHLENSMREVEDRLGRRLDAFYRNAKRGYVRTLATSTGLDHLRQRIKYLQAIMGGDYRLLDDMAGLQKEYRKQISLAKDEMNEINRLEKEEAKRLASLKNDMDERVVLLVKIHQEKEFYETAVKELESAAQSLRDTLISLEKTQERRPGGEGDLPAGFEHSRGKLPLPMPGRIVKESSPAGSGGQNGQKGIFIEGRAGAEVAAVFPGRVDFSGQIKGYGEMIIINHGSRYFTISARLAKRSKTEGEMVNAGEVIGLLGGGDGASRPRLYFEIRRGEGPIDASKWLKVH